MPLSDLIRTLNVPTVSLPGHYARSGLDQPFVAVDGRVFLHYANIRLESQFLPIVEARTGKTHGHAASLQAFGLSNRQPIAADAVFVLPTDDAEFVYLDRLVRTLHALNYLTRPTRGNLLLQVHARHVMSVPADHGLAFEEILRPVPGTDHAGNRHRGGRGHHPPDQGRRQLPLARLRHRHQSFRPPPDRFRHPPRTAARHRQARRPAAVFRPAAQTHHRGAAQTAGTGTDRRDRHGSHAQGRAGRKHRPAAGPCATAPPAPRRARSPRQQRHPYQERRLR